MSFLPDIPRFHTALAEWAACMVFILMANRRFHGWKFIGISAAALGVQSAFLIFTGDVGNLLWLPCMIAAVLFMIGFVYVCMQGSWCDAVYSGLQAFVAAELAASLEWQLHLFIWHSRPSAAAEGVLLLACFTVIYACVWRMFGRHRERGKAQQVTPKELSAVLAITVAAFAMSNLSFLQITTPFSSQYGDAVNIVRTMMDLAGIAMLYAYDAQRNEMRIRRELDAMQRVMENQYLQYEQSKESIELINYKYHDLKHQIAVLRAEADAEKRNAHLDRMEEEIIQYEMQNKTGNKVVDTILTSKSVTCEKYGITLNCVVDGTLLNFMDVMDLCSILGNALDNAIECERKIQDREKRLIHMAVFSQKNFLILRFENYFEGTLELQEGIPVTTKKKKKEYHGYGIKSIKYAVKKYDGAVSISVRDNWFELKALIPLAADGGQAEALFAVNDSHAGGQGRPDQESER